MHRRKRVKWSLLGLLAVSWLAVCSWVYYKWQIDRLPASIPALPTVQIDSTGRQSIFDRGGVFVTQVAAFRDELFAYLMYQHYRGTGRFADDELLLHYNSVPAEPKYEVLLVLSDEVLRSMNRAADLKTDQAVAAFDWYLLSWRGLTDYRNQTRLFVSAYNLPVRRKMEDLSRPELHRLIQRYIQFKSTTDGRVRKRIEPIPAVLTTSEANQLAGDIIAVAEFYDLPLDFLLGIGAMENNYMTVRGDLTHSIWKRRPAGDDIVLERRKGRVRILNDSAGVWQITRETLRFAHRLYLTDKRDYSKLPERLHPPRQLKIDEVSPDALTTYAGLLLRELLDRFNGDVALAVGAYNGGSGNPNMHYQEGVQNVASHARTILQRAAALNGESVMHTSWLVAR